MWVLATCCLVACGKGERREIVLSTGFYENEIFRLEGERTNRGEVMVYLTNIMNQYGQVYGDEIWNTEIGSGSLQSEVKDTVLARIVKIKIMNRMAEAYSITLSEADINAAAQAANAYYTSLSEQEKAAFEQITEEELARMYEEYALAARLYNYITKDVSTEISDDEARSVLVEQIVLYKDDNRNTSENQADADAVRMAEFARQAREEGTDFAELASLYNEAEKDKVSVLRGQWEKRLEDVIFNLERDQISEIVETEDAFYLFHCISPVDYSRIDSAKQEIIDLRKQKLFNDTYAAYADSVKIYLNEEVWDNLAPQYGGGIDTADFFQIYDQYFPE